jgi:hypothetical protein
MKTTFLIVLSFALSWTLLTAQHADTPIKLVSIDFRLQNGPDGLGKLPVTDHLPMAGSCKSKANIICWKDDRFGRFLAWRTKCGKFRLNGKAL